MSEEAAAADAGTAEVDTSAEGTETDPEDAEAAELLSGMSQQENAEQDDWKAKAREWEKRAKQNSKAAARLKEIEQANMSELEKAQAAQRDAEERANTATAMHNRVMAAAANNLPVDLIDHLGSGTEEEINETAEIFARVIEDEVQRRVDEITGGNADRNGQRNSGARPVESMRPGSAPASGGTPTSPDEWFRQLLSER